jgi:anti-sigma factor RsiW
MMHRRYRHALGAYVDGELGGAEVSRLQEHLAGCRECSGELERLERLRDLLRRGLAPAAEAASSLWPGIRARIDRGRPRGSLWAWLREFWEASWERPRLSLAGALVTGFLVLSTGYWLWETPVTTPPPTKVASDPAAEGPVVEAVSPEPGFRAMVLTTSGQGMKVIWVVGQGQI